MDDCCAVCAEPMEWVAYGLCIHKDVCSTCVVRLRNVCDDRKCCICKTECSFVFVTKAMGDYTKTVDLSLLPADPREGQIRPYWYHEATQAYFDDLDHYKMIKAMCTFSCSMCDKEGHQNHGPKKKANFRNLEQLKNHLFHRHRLYMCSLCLEAKKVFICEQKLYTKEQLNQHTRNGDSEVDGTESERGGFMGHPKCEFCRKPFYGDNELYTHMSTEHYTCHICQRQNPGHYKYYRNYDDMEMHFRKDHYLCEDEECLGKKFIVFQSEPELKKHNVLEHGGRMSRSKRNTVLQIPTSFSYRRNEPGARHGRGGSFRQQSSADNQLSLALQARLGTADAESRRSIAQQVLDDAATTLINPLIPPLESLAASDSGPSSRYRQGVSHNYTRDDSSFPPLSATPGNTQQVREAWSQNTMAARLRKKNASIGGTVKILNVAHSSPAANRGSSFLSASSIQTQPMVNSTAKATGPTTSSYSHLISGSSLKKTGSFDPVSDFPPVSSAQSQRLSSSSSHAVKVEDIHTANKSLVERIRATLDHDKEKYAAFKKISQEYRHGSTDTLSYLEYATQFGLLHLVPELARLCPEPHKQKELLEAYNSSLQSSKSDKGKMSAVGESSKLKQVLADNTLETGRRLQSGHGHSEGGLEALEKDGKITKGKSKVTVNKGSFNGGSCRLSDDGGSKRGKRTSKFQNSAR